MEIFNRSGLINVSDEQVGILVLYFTHLFWLVNSDLQIVAPLDCVVCFLDSLIGVGLVLELNVREAPWRAVLICLEFARQNLSKLAKVRWYFFLGNLFSQVAHNYVGPGVADIFFLFVVNTEAKLATLELNIL